MRRGYHNTRWCAAFLILAFCFQVLAPCRLADASAITAPPEGRAMIEAAKAEVEKQRAVEENEIYKAEAEEYVISSAEEANKAQAELKEAREALERAQIDARLTEEVRRIAQRHADSAAQEAEEWAGRVQDAFNQAAAAARRADSLTAAAEKKDREVTVYYANLERELAAEAAALSADLAPEKPDDDRMRYEDELRQLEAERKLYEETIRKMEEARASAPSTTIPLEFRPAPEGGNWAAVRSAYSRAAYLERMATNLDSRSETAQNRADALQAEAEAATSAAEDALLILADAETAVTEYEAYATEAAQFAEQARTDRDRLFEMLNAPEVSRYAQTGVRYHTWSDGRERSGYQTAIPIAGGRWTPNFSWGFNTYYVFSDYLNTLTDTSLYFSKRVEGSKFTIDYILSFNIPTGKSALGWWERFARVTEDLVTVEQFGKGWGVTPGIAVTWKTSEKETWTVGTSYSFSGSYDPTSDIPNDDISPGGEWGKYVRYINATDKRQLVLELANSTFGRTKIGDGSSYKENASWDFRSAYNMKLNERQELMFYYFLERQGSNYLPFATDTPNVHYLGTMWKHKLTPQSDLRLAFDVMTTNGSRPLRMYSYYNEDNSPAYALEEVDGRTKYTLGIGYDHRLNDKSNLNLDLEYFKMEDGITTTGYPATTYDGWNIYLNYFVSF